MIPNCTSLEQSKKLAEYLPKETADKSYILCYDNEYIECLTPPINPTDIPAWSLGKLLDLLPYLISFDSDGNLISHEGQKIQDCYGFRLRKGELEGKTYYQMTYGNALGEREGIWRDILYGPKKETCIDAVAEILLYIEQQKHKE